MRDCIVITQHTRKLLSLALILGQGHSLKTSSWNKLNRPSPPRPFRQKTDNGYKYTAISYTHTIHIVSYR
ncbi:hypothetical protein DLM02_14100 [Salmonella enterica subsp. enterica]|nr:hypothetical protein [Salmonella enterica subsp. enterica serovar 4,12:d:-]EAO9780315.1 hypothetical protein [Salmonella enterica]EBC9132999.1 hypothetical protein [Salmonella enterica subsp. enterica serovar Heidelberg]ECC2843325.1 hypothetical protein [Salmonella enterica subsp. enterica]EAT9915963.1 hypothetical protein [Salmonella enterica]